MIRAALAGAILAFFPVISRAQECDKIIGLERILPATRKPPRFIVMGERHGTIQSPKVFGDLVCMMAQRGAVNVLLEYTRSSTPELQAYFASDGSQAARAKFLANEIWDPRYADGRNSIAMLKLIDFLRHLRQSGANIRVFSTQEDLATSDQFYGELARADDWSKIALDRPDALNLILVGAAHAALSDNGDYGFLPAAAHLRPSDVLAIGPSEEGGSQWSLEVSPTGEPLMGVHKLPGKPSRSAGLVGAPNRSRGWDAILAFGEPAIPSPPARQ